MSRSAAFPSIITMRISRTLVPTALTASLSIACVVSLVGDSHGFSQLTASTGFADSVVIGITPYGTDLDRTYAFSGVDGSGAPQTMTVTAQTGGVTTPDGLRSLAQLSVTNAFSSDSNPVIVDDGTATGYVGVPNRFFLQHNARLFEEVSVSADAAVSTISVQLDVSGEFRLNYPFNMFVGTVLFAGGAVHSSWDYNGPFLDEGSDYTKGVADTVIVEGIPVVDGVAQMDLVLRTTVQASSLTDGTNPYAVSNFANSAVITGVTGFNDAGQVVPLRSVVGQTNGFSYPAIGVPEPSSAVLLMLGMASAAGGRRRVRGGS